MKERKPHEVTESILQASKLAPDQRVGQIISNALELAGINYDYFYAEDDTLLQALNDYIRTIES